MEKKGSGASGDWMVMCISKLGAAAISFAELIICVASLGVSYIAYLMLAILLHVDGAKESIGARYEKEGTCSRYYTLHKQRCLVATV
ncbi:hypothetical protein ANCCAN_18811 [Ancylostoma caninum]|uniref:Uncharacterized protein n=1 Tax=Ancylostoma caninum TaxID=29170 RepID=A0A368FV24_ANCCA|nr:hypothetical protein ANCCAN_18811 [Ancylostoma caninum]